MILAKPATLGLLKIMIFWNESYDVIVFEYDVTSKFLSCDSNYIVYVVMWTRFGNSSIFKREVFRKIWPEKLLFLRGGLGSSTVILESH